MATQIAPTFNKTMFDVVRLTDVFSELAGKRTKYTIKIMIRNDEPKLASTDKKLRRLHGDSVRWECRKPFRLEFEPGQSPEGPNGPIVYKSEHDSSLPASRAHFKQLALNSDDWASAKIELNYIIRVEVVRDRWVEADPSIIIDTYLARVFVPLLKDGFSVNEFLHRLKPVASKAKRPGKARKAAKSASKQSSARRK